MFGESAKADGVRYPPGQRIKSQKREKPRGSAVREAGRGRPEQKPRSASATSRLLRGRFFSSLHSQPLSKRSPCPGDYGKSSCFRPARSRGGKGIPGVEGQAVQRRRSERWFREHCCRANAKLRPFLRLAFFIPQLPGRLVSASTDRGTPTPALLLAASHPSPNAPRLGRTGHQGRSRARRGAPDSQTPPPTKRSHPLGSSLARPDAANSSHLHWRHDGTIPPRPARPETQGAESPCSRHAAGSQHPGRTGRGLRWEGGIREGGASGSAVDGAVRIPARIQLSSVCGEAPRFSGCSGVAASVLTWPRWLFFFSV